MKFAIAFLMAGIGYAAFNPIVRDIFMSQSTGRMIFEYVCFHLAVGAFVMMEFYAGMTANVQKKDYDDYCVGSFLLGLLWPVTVPVYYSVRYVIWPTLLFTENRMTSWVSKRREAFKKRKKIT